MLTLDVAIVTHRPEGIGRVAAMGLPRVEGVHYVVSWQAHEDAPLPAELERDDVEVHRFDGRGISSNRNNALAHCRADVVLSSDDDVTLFADALREVQLTYERNEWLEVATFRSEHGDMIRFPVEATRLRLPYPKNYHATGIELSFRHSGRSAAMRFCAELGVPGGRFACGEDDAFLLSAVRRGLNVAFFPITVCAHPHESTGYKACPSASELRASGVVIALTYGAGALLRVPLKAWRTSRRGGMGFFAALRHLAAGALAAPGLLRRNRDSLW